jgi:hypothetical protein
MHQENMLHFTVLLKQNKNTIVSTRSLSVVTKPVSRTGPETTQYVYVNNPSCAAYSFLPKAPAGEESYSWTSIDLFFSAVHPTLGVWVEIREMDNAGGITRNRYHSQKYGSLLIKLSHL